MTKLIVDLSDPEVAEAVADCKEGEEKTFTVTATMTKQSANVMDFDVSNIEYEGQPSEDAEPADEEAAEPTPTKPPVANAMKGSY